MTTKPLSPSSAPTKNDYTVPQLAAFFKCSPGTVVNWIKSGRIKAYRLGGTGHWRIPWPEVERLRDEWAYSPEAAF